jgi:Do/DeqQ family serine protease
MTAASDRVRGPRGGPLTVATALALLLAATPAAADWLTLQRSDATVAVPESPTQIQLSFAPIVEAAAPAVVNILTSVYVGSGGSRLYDDPFFREFFNRRRPFSQGQDATPQTEPLSLGSGVIVAPDGIVVTNYHVIEGADEITVVLADRREFRAQIIGTDPDTDLAVLRIDVPGPLAYLEMGDPDALKVGDLVLAIGNPFGVGQTVTSGIVSALARTDIGVADYAFFIQTDAAINPGNSGGALVTMDGRLIGINTAIYSETGNSAGIGFAIPVNMVQRVVTALLEGGAVLRPWLGVSMEDVTAAMAIQIGLSRPYGALVVSVAPDSPAHRAGLQPGDVVLAIDGHELENGDAVRFRIGTYAPDDAVALTVMRGGTELRLTAVLALPPSALATAEAITISGRNPLAGSSVVTLTPALMTEFGLGQMRGGALVTAVEPNTAAYNIGLAVGDVVVGVNGREILDAESLAQLVSQPLPLWRISVMRAGELLTVTLRG